MRPMFLLLALATTYSPSLLAQSIPVQAGDRVRIEAGLVSGRFSVVDVTANTLSLKDGAAPEIHISFASIQQIARRDKRTGWQGALHGAGLGFLIGGVTGAITGFASGDDDPGFLSFTAEEKALALGVLLGGSGAVAGGVIGALAPGERWTRVPVPAAPRIGLSSSNGVLIAYSVKW